MNGFNTIAEIPGTDLASEVVMLGAHFDSHPYATGATDNATGSAAMMEAMRILKAVGAKPRRTIRIALWGGEEQGLLGSRAYVREHFAESGHDGAEAGAREALRVLQLGQRHRTRPRHLAAEQHGRAPDLRAVDGAAARPRRDDARPALGGLDRSRVVRRRRHSRRSSSWSDRLEYNSRTHHSNMDTFDRVQRDDMVQQATVIAVFAYDAAMRDEKLPRKALPAPRRRTAATAGW